MPNIAQWHPQIVHFVVAVGILGVVFRIASLIPTFRQFSDAATVLILIAATATVLAVRSGTDAHGPVERIPGARAIVQQHEQRGETTRNIFLGLAVIEIVAWALSRRANTLRYSRYAQYAAALVGLWGCTGIYYTAEEGGELVYSYGGGPGLRTGDPADVQRLLIAGLYNQSRNDRKAKNFAGAASLVDELRRRAPADTNVRFLHAESLLLDRKDARASINALDSMHFDAKDMRNRSRVATMKADAYLALGSKDSARAVLAPIVAAQPQNTRLKAKLDSIK